MPRDFLRTAPERDVVVRIEKLAKEIIAGDENGENVQDLVDALNRLTGSSYDLAELRMVPGSSGTRDFAVRAALGPAPLVTDLSREKIIRLVEIISDPGATKGYYLEILVDGLPNTEIVSLLYGGDRERIAEEIADEALIRVELFNQGGVAAVRSRLVDLADTVRADPTAPIWAQDWARQYRVR